MNGFGQAGTGMQFMPVPLSPQLSRSHLPSAKIRALRSAGAFSSTVSWNGVGIVVILVRKNLIA